MISGSLSRRVAAFSYTALSAACPVFGELHPRALPDLVVLLMGAVDVLLKRIEGRGRPYELPFHRAYLTEASGVSDGGRGALRPLLPRGVLSRP